MTDEELLRVGRAILLGDTAPSSASPDELRKAVVLAVDDVGRRLAPYGFVVRPIDQQDGSLREVLILLAAVLVGIIVLIAVAIIALRAVGQA